MFLTRPFSFSTLAFRIISHLFQPLHPPTTSTYPSAPLAPPPHPTPPTPPIPSPSFSSITSSSCSTKDYPSPIPPSLTR